MGRNPCVWGVSVVEGVDDEGHGGEHGCGDHACHTCPCESIRLDHGPHHEERESEDHARHGRDGGVLLKGGEALAALVKG